ncbi:MAG: hypothetical protein U5R06_02365 [candidate division KSB1 bacterium]|nr:hypothetical protein [candidate division KSB1 bacterium]
MPKTITCILGSQSSGTTLLTEYFKEAGFTLSDCADKTTFFEDPELNNINEQMLLKRGMNWHNVPLHTTFHPDQFTATILHKYFLKNPQINLIKDPRILLLLNIYEYIDIDFQFICTFRNPLATAASIKKRFSLPAEQSVKLWASYYSRMINRKIPVIQFGESVEFSDYIDNLRRCCEFWDFEYDHSAAVNVFNHKKLHIHDPNLSGDHISPLYVLLYKHLQKMAAAC